MQNIAMLHEKLQNANSMLEKAIELSTSQQNSISAIEKEIQGFKSVQIRHCEEIKSLEAKILSRNSELIEISRDTDRIEFEIEAVRMKVEYIGTILNNLIQKLQKHSFDKQKKIERNYNKTIELKCSTKEVMTELKNATEARREAFNNDQSNRYELEEQNLIKELNNEESDLNILLTCCDVLKEECTKKRETNCLEKSGNPTSKVSEVYDRYPTLRKAISNENYSHGNF